MPKPKSLKQTTAANTNSRLKRKTTKNKKTPNKGQEKRCVDHFRHLGISEVETPLGYIDLLTTDIVVEFKIYTNAKDALGQILCYNQFVNKPRMLIVLFGRGLCKWKALPVFIRVCAQFNVEVFALSSNYKYAELKKLLGEE